MLKKYRLWILLHLYKPSSAVLFADDKCISTGSKTCTLIMDALPIKLTFAPLSWDTLTLQSSDSRQCAMPLIELLSQLFAELSRATTHASDLAVCLFTVVSHNPLHGIAMWSRTTFLLSETMCSSVSVTKEQHHDRKFPMVSIPRFARVPLSVVGLG